MKFVNTAEAVEDGCRACDGYAARRLLIEGDIDTIEAMITITDTVG